MRKSIFFVSLFSGISSALYAAGKPRRDLIRIDATQQRQTEQFLPDVDVRMDFSPIKSTALSYNESPCYPIHQIILSDCSADNSPIQSRFSWVLNQSIKRLNVKFQHCFGGEGPGLLMKQMQKMRLGNHLMERLLGEGRSAAFLL
ncbi:MULTISPECIES: hypothetical protein [Rodentibacter]|uniref:hypothetical protein n=1 Tax=Rodentibacter TaxID=1960084 RepID=UPI001CFD30E3|nr:hypothetical protein [Rodentibacter sp. JRC1]